MSEESRFREATIESNKEKPGTVRANLLDFVKQDNLY